MQPVWVTFDGKDLRYIDLGSAILVALEDVCRFSGTAVGADGAVDIAAAAASLSLSRWLFIEAETGGKTPARKPVLFVDTLDVIGLLSNADIDRLNRQIRRSKA